VGPLLEQARGYKSALGRYRERLTQIGNEHAKAESDVKVKHDRERRDLEALIAQQREAAGHSPPVARENVKERSEEPLSRVFARANGQLPQKNSEKMRDRRMNSRSHSYPSGRTRL
jgi:hypothetical protein